MKNKAHTSHGLIRNRWFRFASSLAFAFMLFLIPVTLGVAVRIPSPVLPPDLISKPTSIELPLPFGPALVHAAGGITVTKTTALTVTPGGILTYTLLVTNGTGGDLTPINGVAVYDFTPNEITCLSAQGPSGWGSSCPNTAPNPDVTWALVSGSFAKDAIVVLTFTAQVSTSLAHQAEIVNDNYGASGYDLGPPFTTTIIAPVWGITKTVDKATVQPNEVLQYTITISNIGFAATSGTYTITDEIPANTSIESTGGGSLNGNILTWTFSDPLAASGGSKNVAYTVRITSPITNGVKIVNDGYTVAGGNASAAAVNDPVTTTVNAQAGLSISKTATPSSVTVGNTLTYTLIVTNNTASTYAQDVLITDTLSNYVTYQSAGFLSGTTGNITDTGGNPIIWSLDNPLGPNDSARVTVTVQVSTTLPNPAQITNQFQASGSNTSLGSGSINTTVQASTPNTLTLTLTPNPINNLCETTVATTTVVDAFNNPVSGTSVTIGQFGANKVTPSSSPGTTNAAGVFSTVFRGFEAGSVTMIAQDSGATVFDSKGLTINTGTPIPTDLSLTALPNPLTAGGSTGVVTGTLTDCQKPTPQVVPNQPVTLTLDSISLASFAGPSNSANGNSTLTATLTSTATTTASGVVTITGASTGSGWNLQDVISVTIQPLNTPVLTITKTANPAGTINSGGTISYTLRIDNTGTASANNVVLTDTLPASVTVVNIFSSTNGSGAINLISGSSPVRLSVSTLEQNKSLTATLEVTVTAAISGASLSNYANAGSSSTPLITSNIVAHTVITSTGSSGKVFLPIIIKNS